MHRSERRKARGACLGPRALVKPRHNAVDMDRGSDRDVLDVGFASAISMPF